MRRCQRGSAHHALPRVTSPEVRPKGEPLRTTCAVTALHREMRNGASQAYPCDAINLNGKKKAHASFVRQQKYQQQKSWRVAKYSAAKYRSSSATGFSTAS